MKILIVSPSYKPAYIYGGPAVSVSELAESLATNGHDVTVYTTTANGKEELNVAAKVPIMVNGVTVYYFRRQTGDHTHVSFGLWRKLWSTAGQFDVIHLQSWWSLLILGSALICRVNRYRYIVSPRGMLSQYSFSRQHNLPKKLVHLVIGKGLLKKSILHATTRLEWDDCRSVHQAWTGFILPNIVRLPIQSQKARPEENEQPFVLGFLSRIDHKKGLEILFEALALIDIPFQLKIAGTGDDAYIASLKTLATKLKIANCIEWRGWIGGEEKFSFLSSVDLFTLTSHNENFANAVIESLAVGTPVLVSNDVGLSDFVKHNQLGWVCELQVSSIAKTLTEIMTQETELNRIRKVAPELITKSFNKVQLGHQYSKAYEQYC